MKPVINPKTLVATILAALFMGLAIYIIITAALAVIEVINPSPRTNGGSNVLVE